MNIITLIVKSLETFLVAIGLAYFLDYNTDGDIDLPHKKVDFKEMGIYRITQRIYRYIKRLQK